LINKRQLKKYLKQLSEFDNQAPPARSMPPSEFVAAADAFLDKERRITVPKHLYK